MFDPTTTSQTLNRLDKLSNSTKPVWGKTNAPQMLAHLNIPYDIAYGKKESKPSFFTKLMLKMFVKKIVVGDKPYAKNSRTSPDFIVADERDFEKEKEGLIANIKKQKQKA